MGNLILYISIMVTNPFFMNAIESPSPTELQPTLHNQEDAISSNPTICEPYEEKAPKTSEEQNVMKVVEQFGRKLKYVSLHAKPERLKREMSLHYGDLVTEDLLEIWQNNPTGAPGRLTSSPWPDAIEILALKKVTKDSYLVKGQILEKTRLEVLEGGYAAKRDIRLIVVHIKDKWLIKHVTLGHYV